MNVEARLGSDQFVGSDLSPRKAEQIIYPRNNHRFPWRDRREFFETLRREIPFLSIDLLRLWNDFVVGGIERTRLEYKLRDGLKSSNGDRLPVAIAPGFGSVEWWYYPTVAFFEIHGHPTKIIPSGRIFNTLPIEKKKEKYMQFIYDLANENGQKVHYLGDSQGGLVGAALAVDYQSDFEGCVEDAWFIGAPKPNRVNVAVGLAYLWSQLWYDSNDFRLASELEKLAELESEGKVPFRSIYHRSDPVLPDGVPIGEHFETDGSHTGGGVNLKHLELIVSTWSKNGQSSENEGAAKAVAAA